MPTCSRVCIIPVVRAQVRHVPPYRRRSTKPRRGTSGSSGRSGHAPQRRSGQPQREPLAQRQGRRSGRPSAGGRPSLLFRHAASSACTPFRLRSPSTEHAYSWRTRRAGSSTTPRVRGHASAARTVFEKSTSDMRHPSSWSRIQRRQEIATGWSRPCLAGRSARRATLPQGPAPCCCCSARCDCHGSWLFLLVARPSTGLCST